MADYSVILTTASGSQEARDLARALVQGRLAACVQVVPVESHYEWDGKLEETSESLLVIKTRSGRYADVERLLQDRHSYDVPEVVETPISNGARSYLDWIDASTTP